MTAMTVHHSHLPPLCLPRVGAWSGSLTIHLLIAALLLTSPAAIRLITRPPDRPDTITVTLHEAPKPAQPIPAQPVPPRPLRQVQVKQDITHAVAIRTPLSIDAGLPAPVVFTPAPVTAPTTASSLDTPPTALAYGANTRVAYPIDALRRHDQGTVVLRVLVSATGNVLDVAVAHSSGSARLDRAALAAVRNWRFRPATEGGMAQSAWARVPITFDLSRL